MIHHQVGRARRGSDALPERFNALTSLWSSTTLSTLTSQLALESRKGSVASAATRPVRE
jgi:hypothetical protein